ncbi:MAG: IS66 family transposase [Deltaproteobacteria bacterium]|nr:IS66 family transposase [Deltaproteobacteria bacterium]
MTRDEATAILDMNRDKAIEIIVGLAEKAEKYDRMCGDVSPSTPSGMIPVYLKPSHGKRKKRPGRKPGHPGVSRISPDRVSDYKEHTLDHCPDCHAPLNKPVKSYKRYIEDVPQIEPVVTEHTVYGYWCSQCRKIVFPRVSDALPNSMIGLRLVVFTAWLHYLVGVSVSNLVKMLSVVSTIKMSAGGLTQAWKNLAFTVEPLYSEIGCKAANSAVLNTDETGWRLNGITHWLWCFATKKLCYYVITRSRGSPVVEEVLGTIFKGILICDFWGAYNKISALAKQRCFYHLFTELVKVDKHNLSPEWRAFRKKLSRLLKDAIRLSEKQSRLRSEDFIRKKGRFYKRLDRLLTTDHECKDVKRLIKRLKRHKNELFTFLEYKGVSPYNNHAEQQMRKAVLARKVSQQNRSEQGVKVQAILMTLFRTAELQGQNPVETVLNAAKSTIESKNASIGYFKKAA